MDLRRVALKWHKRRMIVAGHRRYYHPLAPGQYRRSRGGLRIARAQASRPRLLLLVALQQSLGMGGRNPASLFGDAYWNHFVFLLVDRVQHRGGRQQRHLVLATAPAKQDTNP